MKMQRKISFAVGVAALSFASQGAFAACSDVTRLQLKAAADFVKANDGAKTVGLGNHMWVTMVDNTGKVCHVVNTAGEGQRSSQTWGVSRVISAQKANTSAGLSLNAVPPNPIQPWASGMVYAAAQPGGFLYGVQHSNPVDASRAYDGSPAAYGTSFDPLINKRIGGINVFGGGLPLYLAGKKIGAIGASGDTSCTDHAFAWRVRLALDVAGRVDANTGDEIDISGGAHPACPNPPAGTPAEIGIK